MNYLLASLLWIASVNEPRYLSGLFFELGFSSQVDVNSSIVIYDIYREQHYLRRSFTKEQIDFAARKSYKISERILKSMGKNHNDCRSYINLHIYEITKGSLNRTDIGPWKVEMGLNDKEFFGLYDPTTWVRGESALMVGDNAPYPMGTLVHEFSHYWYDRWCLTDSIGMDTESFAYKAEYIYVNE